MDPRLPRQPASADAAWLAALVAAVAPHYNGKYADFF